MRGSRPGERRGGRKKGTLNKKTACARAMLAAHSNNPNATPMDVILAVMRDPHVAVETRVTMALTALPHLHRKLLAGESASIIENESLAARRRKENLSMDTPRLDEPLIERRGNEAAAMKNGEARSSKSETASRVAEVPAASAEVPIPAPQEGNGTAIMPLPFLLEVLNDPKMSAAIKLKVATATIAYTHPKQSTRPAKPSVVPDRFGFTVEPALAIKLRNETARLSVLKKRRNPHPRDRNLIIKLHKRIDAQLATLQCPCPSSYSVKQAAIDKETIERLWRKRRSRRKLNQNEDTVLAHINARYWAFAFGPEVRARKRLHLLTAKERSHRLAYMPPLTPWEKGELKLLAILYPPDVPEVDRDHEATLERNSAFSKFPPDSIPDPEEDGFRLPPYCAVDRELSEKRGRTILKWTFETSQSRSIPMGPPPSGLSSGR
jgi:hypothetical protein